MNITFEEFKSYLTRFMELKQESNDWADKLPEDLISLYDNTYVNNMGLQLDLTMELLFKEYYDDVAWFIWECYGNKSILSHPYTEDKPNIVVRNRGYYIHNLESYLDYASKELKFKVDKVD